MKRKDRKEGEVTEGWKGEGSRGREKRGGYRLTPPKTKNCKVMNYS